MDYNDETLLHWAGTGCVVSDSPDQVKSKFHDCGEAHEGALHAAIKIWNR